MQQEEYAYIEHEALIIDIDRSHRIIKVRVDNQNECGDCPASKVCGSSGEPSNEIEIPVKDVSNYKLDDIVTIRGTEQMHRKAIMYATVFPCILLVAVMVGIYLLTFNQIAAALSGLGVMIFFYIVLWAMKNRIAHEFNFQVVGSPERREVNN